MNSFLLKFIILNFCSAFVLSWAEAKLTYEGQLTDASDNPIASASVDFKISILNPAESCVLYSETHTAVITSALGYFSLLVGGGTVASGSVTYANVFNNFAAMTSTISAACTYTPVSTDDRRMKVEVDAGVGYEILGTLTLGKTPATMHADYVGGLSITNLLRVAVGDTAPVLSSGDVSQLPTLLAGTSSLYAKNNTNNGTSALPSFASNPASPVAGNIWFDTTNNVIKYYNGSNIVSIDTTAAGLSLGTVYSGDISGTYAAISVDRIKGAGLSFAGLANHDILQYNGTNFINRNIPTCSAGNYLSFNGSTFSCSAVLNSSDITSALAYVPLKPANNLSDLTNTVLARSNLGLGSADSPTFTGLTVSNLNSATLVKTDGSGNFSNAAAADITGLLGYSVVAGVSTPKVITSLLGSAPGAGISGAGAILIASDTKQIFTSDGTSWQQLVPVFNAGSAGAPSIKFSGSLTSGLFSPAADTIAISSGGVESMRIDASGFVGIGTNAPISALDVNGNISASGSINASGNLTVNSMISSPFGVSPGETGQISFKELSGNGSFKFTIKAPDDLTSNRNLVLPDSDGNAAEVLQTDGLGNLSWASLQNRYVNGGNPFGGISYIGTNDNYDFVMKTNNTNRIYVKNSGQVGIGLASPDADLAVAGTLRASSISNSHNNQGASSTVNFSAGNHITSSYNCGAALTINDLRDGGSYRWMNVDTGTTACNFSTTLTGADAGGVTFKFLPPNGARTASSSTLYEFMRFGSTVLVRWASY